MPCDERCIGTLRTRTRGRQTPRVVPLLPPPRLRSATELSVLADGKNQEMAHRLSGLARADAAAAAAAEMAGSELRCRVQQIICEP